MKSRIPALLVVALALCALPEVRAFASAVCATCCSDAGSEAQGPACAMHESGCCELAPATPAALVEHTNAQPPAPALASAHVLAPVSWAPLAPLVTRELALASSPLRLSVVRLL
jgi:hypothetical protein